MKSIKAESSRHKESDFSAPRGMSPRRQWALRGLAVALGLVLVLMLEGGLRLAGMGGLPPLTMPGIIRQADDPGERTEVRRVNVAFMARFFSRRDSTGLIRSGGMREEAYRAPKAEGTLRVVMVGESTIEGFPLPRNLTSSAFLAEYLRQMAPDRQVEVLNLGATAVASYPIRCVAIEAIETMEPDVVVVYGAHNEFFGAGGVASRETLGGSVRAMRVRHWTRGLALYQGMERMLPKGRDGEMDADANLITVMAQEGVVAPNDKRRARAAAQLAENWSAIARAARRAGVDVVFCTTASNTRDMAPMASWEADGELDSAELLRLADEATSETLELHERLMATAREHPNHAIAQYAAARVVEAGGNRVEANALYRRARDLDGLPWRATTELNEALRHVAAREGAALADVERAFDDASGGAPGWLFFDDHVHPSLRGQAMLAEVVARAMAREGVAGLDVAAMSSIPDWLAVAQTLGANPLERLRVIDLMASLYDQPPLRLNNEKAREMFWTRRESMKDSADEVERLAINNWSASNREVGRSLPISYFALAAMLRADRLDQARVYRRGAVLNQSPFTGEELAARLLNLVSVGLDGQVSREQFDDMRRELATVHRLVSVFPGEPTVLTRYVEGSLALLDGNRTGFDEAMDSVAADRESAPVRVRVYLRELPERTAWGEIRERLEQSWADAVAGQEAAAPPP